MCKNYNSCVPVPWGPFPSPARPRTAPGQSRIVFDSIPDSSRIVKARQKPNWPSRASQGGQKSLDAFLLLGNHCISAKHDVLAGDRVQTTKKQDPG